MKEKIMIDDPCDYDNCVTMADSTPARICIGNAGTRLKTQTYLQFRADHAIAMDAVWAHADETIPDSLGFYKVTTQCPDKMTYLKRPDLGRIFSEETLQGIKDTCHHHIDVQIIAGDGLSAPAIPANLGEIYPALTMGLSEKGYTLGDPIYVRYARVATMDRISEALDARVTVILIGERPGLGNGESMSAYIAYESSTSKPESQRTVVSNIHKKGIKAADAALRIISLIEKMMEQKTSGVDLSY